MLNFMSYDSQWPWLTYYLRPASVRMPLQTALLPAVQMQRSCCTGLDLQQQQQQQGQQGQQQQQGMSG
jgi:hypothetical protein